MLTADPAGPERWAATTRRGSGKPDIRVGQADGSKEALKVPHAWTLQCRRAGCGALVDWRAAKRSANRAQRGKFLCGDGCTAKRCTRRYDDARFKETQRRMAAALLNGTRLLAAWPKDADDTAVWRVPDAVRDAAAAVAAAR